MGCFDTGSHTLAPGCLRSASATSCSRPIGMEVSPVGISTVATCDQGPRAMDAFEVGRGGAIGAAQPTASRRMATAALREPTVPCFPGGGGSCAGRGGLVAAPADAGARVGGHAVE